MRTVRMVSEQLIALIAMVRTAHPTYIVYISRYKSKNSVLALFAIFRRIMVRFALNIELIRKSFIAIKFKLVKPRLIEVITNATL
jgi:hypothetical protein